MEKKDEIVVRNCIKTRLIDLHQQDDAADDPDLKGAHELVWFHITWHQE